MYDVTICIQRSQMVARIVREIERYVAELGTEGRLVNMQLEELLVDVKDQGDLVVKDYYVEGVETPENVLQTLESWSSEELLDLTLIARALGYGAQAANLDAPVTPRGYRMLSKIPRLPATVIENLVQSFKRFPSIDEASITELDQVEGIGEVRPRHQRRSETPARTRTARPSRVGASVRGVVQKTSNLWWTPRPKHHVRLNMPSAVTRLRSASIPRRT